MRRMGYKATIYGSSCGTLVRSSFTEAKFAVLLHNWDIGGGEQPNAEPNVALLRGGDKCSVSSK